jgi:hypothetical protein
MNKTTNFTDWFWSEVKKIEKREDDLNLEREIPSCSIVNVSKLLLPILSLPRFFVGIFVGIRYHLLVLILFPSQEKIFSFYKLPSPSNEQ